MQTISSGSILFNSVAMLGIGIIQVSNTLRITFLLPIAYDFSDRLTTANTSHLRQPLPDITRHKFCVASVRVVTWRAKRGLGVYLNGPVESRVLHTR